ncbi:MAG: FtsX-like permease family protein [Asgard group archaeon]|nr:FtsX-like permease family protein [Asgard group archaeon]
MTKKTRKIPRRNTLIAKSAIRDIYQKKTRSLTTIIAVMFVTAFPIAFLKTSDSLTLSLDNESETLKLGHIGFRSSFLNDTLIQQIEMIVDDETNNTALLEKRVVAYGATMNLEETYSTVFIGVNNSSPPKINQITIDEGYFASEATEVMILSSFAKEANLERGDEITIKGFTGEKTLEIVALVHSIEWLNFKLTNNAVLWMNESVVRELQGLSDNTYTSVLVYLSEETAFDDVLAVGERVRQHFISLGIPLTFVDYPRELSIRAILIGAADLISRYLSICTVLTIIISGFVMYIIMSRFVAEQRRLIGVFHSFGFRYLTIIRMFTIRAAVLGAIGCLLGVGVSYGILSLITMNLGQSWGVTTIVLSVDWFTILWVCLMAMGSTLVFAIIPALGVARMNPYEALRGKMTTDVTKKSIIDYLLFTKYLPQIPRIGIRNLNRQKVRTWVTIFSVMSALALSASLVATVDITNHQIPKNINESINWDVEAYFHLPVSQAVIDSYASLSHVEIVESYFRMTTMTTTNDTSIIFLDVQPWNSNMTRHNFREGHGFSEEGSNECLISARVMHDLGMSNGDNITLWFYQMQLEFTIVGVSDSWASPSSVIIQKEHLESILGPAIRFTAIRMIVEDGYQDEIVDSLNDNDTSISFATTNDLFLKKMMEIVHVEQEIAYVAVVLGFIVAFIAIFNTTFISSLERTREFAIMRAFGFSNYSILQISGIENAVLTPASFLAGMVLAYPITLVFLGLIEKYTQTIPYNFSWQTVWITLLFAFGTTLIAVIPGWFHNIKQELANSLREE